MKLQGGPNICGATIGVLCLESSFPKPPGHIKNPSGLCFPVLYETVRGATVAKLINEPSAEFIAPFLDAAKRLEAEGVGAITGSCGFLALFQKELATAVGIPVFASSLIQVPMVHHMLGGGKRVGVLTASARKLTPRHFEAVGAGGIPVAIEGMEEQPEFREVILEGRRNDMDVTRIAREILSAAQSLVTKNRDIGAVVLECTDMPPYAHRIQESLRLPVFDLTTLATMVHDVVLRRAYDGIMPRTVRPAPV
jgi:Asp/Glu/hydantoin racemase